MQCRSHPTKAAANTCNQCGSWLCDDCTVDVHGRLFCRPCLTELAKSAPPPPSSGATSPEKVSYGKLLFFSLFLPIPGANYMYMGLMRRGLATMATFFMLIFLFTITSFPLTLILAFSIVILGVASFIDGFHVRRRINAGEHVPDDLGEVINSIMANKKLRTIILAVVAFVLIATILDFAFSVISAVFPWLIVAFVVYIIVKRRKPPSA